MKPVTSTLTLLKIYLALISLLLLTTWLAFVPLGHFSTPVALSIAVIKALLVVIFFMELRHDPPMTRIVAGVGVCWLFIMIALTLSDYLSRNWLPQPSHWPAGPERALYEVPAG